MRWTECIRHERNCQLRMSPQRMVISKERRKEEDPMDNIEKEGPERAGRDDREVEESDAKVP